MGSEKDTTTPEAAVQTEPDRETKKGTEYLKYTFTPEEKAVHADDLARGLSDLGQLKIKKKQLVKEVDSDIADAEKSIAQLATYVKDGYKYQYIEVEIEYDYTTRKKTITRTDTGVVVRTVPMTVDELQKVFDFQPDPQNLSRDKDA
jgi:uncharacterized protein YjhX (UPF0386 family)